MKSFFLAAAVAGGILAMAGGAQAQAPDSSTTTTTTTWTNDQGSALTQYSTTQKYSAVTDPTMQPTVGMVLPGSVAFYPVPQTVNIPNPDMYNYTIINGHPVLVERTTRKIVHTWD